MDVLGKQIRCVEVCLAGLLAYRESFQNILSEEVSRKCRRPAECLREENTGDMMEQCPHNHRRTAMLLEYTKLRPHLCGDMPSTKEDLKTQGGHKGGRTGLRGECYAV